MADLIEELGAIFGGAARALGRNLPLMLALAAIPAAALTVFNGWLLANIPSGLDQQGLLLWTELRRTAGGVAIGALFGPLMLSAAVAASLASRAAPSTLGRGYARLFLFHLVPYLLYFLLGFAAAHLPPPAEAEAA